MKLRIFALISYALLAVAPFLDKFFVWFGYPEGQQATAVLVEHSKPFFESLDTIVALLVVIAGSVLHFLPRPFAKKEEDF